MIIISFNERRKRRDKKLDIKSLLYIKFWTKNKVFENPFFCFFQIIQGQKVNMVLYIKINKANTRKTL